MKTMLSAAAISLLVACGATACLAESDAIKAHAIPILHQNPDAPQILNDLPWVKGDEAQFSCSASERRKSGGRCS